MKEDMEIGTYDGERDAFPFPIRHGVGKQVIPHTVTYYDHARILGYENTKDMAVRWAQECNTQIRFANLRAVYKYIHDIYKDKSNRLYGYSHRAIFNYFLRLYFRAWSQLPEPFFPIFSNLKGVIEHPGAFTWMRRHKLLIPVSFSSFVFYTVPSKLTVHENELPYIFAVCKLRRGDKVEYITNVHNNVSYVDIYKSEDDYSELMKYKYVPVAKVKHLILTESEYYYGFIRKYKTKEGEIRFEFVPVRNVNPVRTIYEMKVLPKPIVAKANNVSVIKALNNDMKSPYQNFKYELNNEYTPDGGFARDLIDSCASGGLYFLYDCRGKYYDYFVGEKATFYHATVDGQVALFPDKGRAERLTVINEIKVKEVEE